MRLREGALLLLASICVMGAAKDCHGKASEAAYAGDGDTKFSDDGKLQWNTTYSAKDAPYGGDRCKWEVYTTSKRTGKKVKTVGHGNYFTAKIKSAHPDTVYVWLHSKDCGHWKPANSDPAGGA